jgi:hypothetical protein
VFSTTTDEVDVLGFAAAGLIVLERYTTELFGIIFVRIFLAAGKIPGGWLSIDICVIPSRANTDRNQYHWIN